MPESTMNLVKLPAIVIAALLLASFVSAQHVQAVPTVKTLLDVGLQEVQNQEVPSRGDTDTPLPKIVHVGENVTVYGRISIVNDRGVKTSEGVPNANVKLVDIFNTGGHPLLLATGTTNERGFFVIQWHVEAKTIFKKLPNAITEGITSIESITLVVMAVYDGDSTYMPSTSLGYNMVLDFLRLKTSISTDKQLYNIGEVGQVNITFKDSTGNLVDPDSLAVSFDSFAISPTKQSVGTYFFITPALSESVHTITVIADKGNYLEETKTATITASPTATVPVTITATLDQRAYGIGDLVELAGNVKPLSLGRQVLLQITNPNDVIYNVGQVSPNQNGAFNYEFKLGGPLALPGKWRITTTYHGQQSVSEFEVGNLQTKFIKLNIESPETIDDQGNPASQGSVGLPLGIQAQLTNSENINAKLLYIVKVSDADGVTIMVSWIKSDLRSGTSIKPAIFWIPEAPGNYTIDIFTWDSLDNPVPLSAPAKIKVSVS